MTKQLELAKPPYTPPYAAERAWQSDGRDDWILHSMRASLVDALEASIKMDERNPEMRRQVGHEVVRFRSNRMRVGTIDNEIVYNVKLMSLEDIEKLAFYRHENADELDAYPRAVLDAFQQDIVDHIDEAGMWDRAAAARWQAHREAVNSLGNRWLDDTTVEFERHG